MSGAVEGVALLPCPWCQSANISADTVYEGHNAVRGFVECQACRVRGPLSGLLFADSFNDLPMAHVRARRVATAAWNTRTTPPARSYADGVEDAAKAVEALRREVPYEYNKHPCSETKRRAIAAIRLLSQGEKA